MPERTMIRVASSTSMRTIVTVAARFMTRLRHRPWKAWRKEKLRKRIEAPDASAQYSRW